MRFKKLIISISAIALVGLFAVTCSSGGALDDDVDDDAGEDEWQDPDTGLIWQVRIASDYVNWGDAVAYCNGLQLAGRGDWRLPTISELRTLIDGCPGSQAGGDCPVTDSCLEAECQDGSCYSCDYGDGPNRGCYGRSELENGCGYCWSSSRVADDYERAWAVGFTSAFVYKPRIYYAFYARCVR